MNKKPIEQDWKYCRAVLPMVSRTFAINIERLEGETYKTVLIGYLLFRIADTFEDNALRTEAEQVSDLRDFSLIFEGNKSLNERLNLLEPLKHKWEEDSNEKSLIENSRRVMSCYFDLPDTARRTIDPLIFEAVSGMIKFKQLKIRSNTAIYQLSGIKELEEYCYYAAGVVGVMLTNIFCSTNNMKGIKSKLKKHQIPFGLALQMVNIIKDYKTDIKRGWCYIPKAITEKHRIDPAAIEALSIKQEQGMIADMASVAIPNLDSALEYIKLLPLEERPVRMFCIIPFVLAYNTLDKIFSMKGNKLSRIEVASLLRKCPAFGKSNESLEKDYLRVKRRLSSE